MRRSLLLSLLIFICVVGFWSMVPVGCANIIPPSGGPRDSTPPVLVRADPGDSTVNFHGKRIILTFDEYVDLKDVQNNLLFTPTFQNNPAIQARGKTITIPFRDSLEPNTTYVLNFGNAIVDWNEGNPLKNFRYTFSTGPVLDSLEISGRVILAETGGVDTTLLAVLHKNLSDSAVRNERPLYVVRVDSEGSFRFHNLPNDTFALYIIEPIGTVRQYRDSTKLFAFANAPVVAGQTDSLLLYAYRAGTRAAQAGPGAQGQRIPPSDRRLRFTTPTGAQDLQSDYTISFPTPLKQFDSSRVQLTSDSAFNRVAYNVRLDTSGKQLSFSSQWKEDTKYNLVLEREFASDTNGRQLLKTDTLFFTTKKLSDYGGITIRFRNLDLSRRPLLQFVQNNTVQFSAPLTTAIYKGTLLTPGEYNLRIVYDTNGNGKWDPGQFFGVRRQPEMVRPIERTIAIKPSMENEVEIVVE